MGGRRGGRRIKTEFAGIPGELRQLCLIITGPYQFQFCTHTQVETAHRTVQALDSIVNGK